MAEYISSFTTGFGEVIAEKLPMLLKGVTVIGVYDGLVHYRYNGDYNNINKIIFFNNSYFVGCFFKNRQVAFSQMVSEVASKKIRYLINRGSFRIRFSRSNQFEKVDKHILSKAETLVMRTTNLNPDRLNPATELWYCIRDEGFGFYGQLLKKRAATEKNLNKGELRPEFACLMCCCTDYTENSVVMDPFAGFGAIPLQIKKHFKYRQIIVNDNDKDKVRRLKQVFQNCGSKVQIFCDNALKQVSIEDGSIDSIVTDPPWGYFENITDIGFFYCEMLKEFKRIIKKDGTVAVLSARKDVFTLSVETTKLFSIARIIHTLVNGKKAAVYMLKPS